MAEREFSSGGIVLKEETDHIKVLLIKDGYGRWTWPKGNIKKSEASKDAAIREIKEETGLDNLEVVKKIGQTQYFYKLKGKLIFKTVYFYLVKAQGDTTLKIQTKEIQDAKWFSPKEALEKVEYKGSRELLETALKEFKNYKR